jgi:polysaccharide export outer membrane protein
MTILRLQYIAIVIWACQSAIGQTPPARTTQDPAKNLPADAAPVAVPDAYIIGSTDVLFIRVFDDTNMTGYYTVSPDGKITVPLIGDIQTDGLTRKQLTTQLTQALSEKLVNPNVTIQLAQVNSKKYYISGEVNHSGPYPLTAPITVFDALNSAGGFKDFAKKSKIVIARGEKRIKFDYQEVLKGKKLEQNIQLQNGDTIIVT